MSLAGKRVLVTRSREQASELAAKLEAKGAEVILVPTIEIAPPSSYCTLDAALACLRSFDWVVFTSANAVGVFAERARQIGVTSSPKKIAVVGPATAKAVEANGLRVDLVPPVYVAESLGEALIPFATGVSILLVRAEVAPERLPELLRAAGAQVTVASAYRTVVPAGSVAMLREMFAEKACYPDAVTFTSASTVTNLLVLLEADGLKMPPGIALVSIGPVTSRALREAGLEPSGEAGEATLESLCEAVERCLEPRAATPNYVRKG